MSVELLIEVWHDIKAFVPSKDRLDVAHVLVSKFDEYGISDGIEKTEIGLDKVLKEAVAAYYHLDDEDEYEESDEDGEYDYDDD